MEYRGPSLLVFGMSLFMSPLAINLVTTGMPVAEPASTEVAEVDVGDACDGQRLPFLNGSVLCTEQTNARLPERRMPGGALFVSARE